MSYEILVDGRSRTRVGSDNEVREWLARYREEHAQDDPDATHVQVLERGGLSWLTGGKMIDRERFLEGPPRTIAGRLESDS